ncbi:hypothetical protein [Microbacterium aurantiacum]|uniref:hypothetical protein n=1 Tax=Microbacterium aurantiacum TaxID=162393 RepID=UPI003D75FBF4
MSAGATIALVGVSMIPDLPADPASVAAAATAVRASVDGVADAGRDAVRRWGGLVEAYETPETATAVASLSPVDDAAAEWATAATAIARALEDYAEILEQQKREIDQLHREISGFLAGLRSFQRSQREQFAPDGEDLPSHLLFDPSHLVYNDDLRARCQHVAAMLDIAAETCRSDLGAVSGPTTSLPPASVPAPLSTLGPTGIATLDDRVTAAILDALVRAAGTDADADAVAALLAAHPDYLDVLAAGTADPAAVAAWWESDVVPGSALAAALITGASLAVGGLNGIPAPARVAANRETAARRLAEARAELEDTPAFTHQGRVLRSNASERAALEAEIAYLERVAAGERSLYLYDPRRERIIEMIGDPSRAAYSITYVPGTGTDMASYYSGGVQSVAQYLVEQDTTGRSVAFVYTDGPWASWGLPFQETSNANRDFARGEGAQLARFEDGLRTDGQLASATHVGIAHSAGMSVLSSAEVAGAEYDQVKSLAGSWLQDGWSAREGTDYAHHQYGVDAINYLNPFYDTPQESSAFAQHEYTPSTFLGIQNELDNHVRVAEGPRRNSEVLRDLYREIHE